MAYLECMNKLASSELCDEQTYLNIGYLNQLDFVETSNDKTYFYDRYDRVHTIQESGSVENSYNFNDKGECKIFRVFDGKIYCLLDNGYFYIRENNDNLELVMDSMCTDIYATENFFLCVNQSLYIEFRDLVSGKLVICFKRSNEKHIMSSLYVERLC